MVGLEGISILADGGFTVIENEHCAVFPEASVATHVIFVNPTLNALPFKVEPVPVVAPLSV
jgi:hypothetical protein